MVVVVMVVFNGGCGGGVLDGDVELLAGSFWLGLGVSQDAPEDRGWGTGPEGGRLDRMDIPRLSKLMRLERRSLLSGAASALRLRMGNCGGGCCGVNGAWLWLWCWWCKRWSTPNPSISGCAATFASILFFFPLPLLSLAPFSPIDASGPLPAAEERML